MIILSVSLVRRLVTIIIIYYDDHIICIISTKTGDYHYHILEDLYDYQYHILYH